jgi:hypothetical protein
MVKKVVLLSVLLALVAGMANAQPVPGAAAYWPMEVRDAPGADQTPDVAGVNHAQLYQTDGVAGVGTTGSEADILGPGGPAWSPAALVVSQANQAADPSPKGQFAVATDTDGNLAVGSSDATWAWWWNKSGPGAGEDIYLENLGAGGVGYTIYHFDQSTGIIDMHPQGCGASWGVWTPTIGQWYHMAVVKQTVAGTIATYTLYIDGAQHGAAHVSSSIILDGGAIWIGKRNPAIWGQETAAGGAFDDVLLYKRALSVQEIGQLIPEPATLCLLGLGGLALIRRRK